MSPSKSLVRRRGKRPYRKVFIVATEGKVTEAQYLTRLNSWTTTVHVKPLKTRGASSPTDVLKRMNRHLEDADLRRTDEAWLVVDRDSWTEADLKALCDWAAGDERRGVAVSNPKFEFWLLLHFEDGNGAATPREVDRRLRTCMPNYSKGVGKGDISEAQVDEAVRRAELRDRPPCADWPRNPPGSTVYRLVGSIRSE